jgi:hypothetical protein
MSQRSKRLKDTARWLLAAVVLAGTGPTATALAVPVVEPPFDDHYALVDLGDIDGLPPPYGVLSFVPGDPDAIVVSGYTGAEIAKLYAAGLTRDATGSISGFAGSAVAAVEAYAAGGGMAYGPGGVLFYTRVTFEMGEVKPGSSVTDKVVNLRSLFWSPGGLNFVPPGLGGAGTLKLVTFACRHWWSLAIAPDANGTYDVTVDERSEPRGQPHRVRLRQPPERRVPSAGLLVCEPGSWSGRSRCTDVDGARPIGHGASSSRSDARGYCSRSSDR